MDPVETRYIERDGPTLAYQVWGRGSADVVICADLNQHLDLCWTDPHIHGLMERMGRNLRLAFFQPRGFGPSGPIGERVAVEQYADDVMDVMNAAGMKRACLYGGMTTGPAAALAAARNPDRVTALVLANVVAQGLRATDEPRGWTTAQVEATLRKADEAIARWGEGYVIELWDSALATPYNRRLAALLERCSATPAVAKAYVDYCLGVDATEIFRSVQVPTRVLRTPANAYPEAAVRYVAELVPNATFYELPPTQIGASTGESFISVMDHVEEMARGAPPPPDVDRFLSTVLFTDICSSTNLLAEIGDARYKETRSAHERQVRFAVESSGGQLVNVIGDGTFSVFDGPARAVRCAQQICQEAEGLGIRVRAGLHTGEVERTGRDLSGMTVHIGARVASAAGPGEVLVTRTVRDLVMFSGLSFLPRGDKELKGVPGRWELCALDIGGIESTSLPHESSMQKPLDRLALQMARRAPGLGRTALRVGNILQRRRAASSSPS
jgi:class 3 adenylate cyclase/pimeloyl-ACP methyl ester carboxylesterase